jgi:hypothetical protein
MLQVHISVPGSMAPHGRRGEQMPCRERLPFRIIQLFDISQFCLKRLTYDKAALLPAVTIPTIRPPDPRQVGRLGEGSLAPMPGQDFLILGASGIIVASTVVWLIWLWRHAQ